VAEKEGLLGKGEEGRDEDEGRVRRGDTGGGGVVSTASASSLRGCSEHLVSAVSKESGLEMRMATVNEVLSNGLDGPAVASKQYFGGSLYCTSVHS
jgi:hypothetical protein